MVLKYVLILVWIGFMAIVAKGQYRQEYDELTGEYVWRVTPVFAIIVMIPVIWMAATREYIADTFLYLANYYAMPTSFFDLPLFFRSIQKDHAFYILSCIIHIIFNNKDVIYLGIIATIQAIGVVFLFRKYSSDYVFSTFLFIVSSDYISWMFNGIRQFLAVAIIILGTPWMLKEKKGSWVQSNIKWIVLVLIASTFHKSSLLMIPLVLIAKGEPWNKKTILFMGLVVLAVAFVGRFTGLLDDALQGTQYSNVVTDYTTWNDDGTNPIRVAVYSVPALISFLYRNKLRVSQDKLIFFCTNMSIISMGLYLLSMVTSGIFIGRIPIFVSLYSYILLPWELDNLFQNRGMMRLLTISAYLLFYYVQMHLTFGLL